ncbi:MAG: hypothetical protein AB7V18_02065 [Pyrinomonadaceae bacterium]
MKNLAICAVMLLIHGSLVAQGVGHQDILSIRVGDFVLTNANATSVLRERLSKHRIRLSLEYSRSDMKSEPSTISISGNNATLRKLLDGFVQLNPNYRWSVEKGIVSIKPEEVSDREELLDVHLGDFTVSDRSKRETVRAIFETSEVSLFLLSNGLRENTDSTGFGDITAEGCLNVARKNVSVKQLLDDLLLSESINFWAVFRTGGGRYIRIVID